MMGRLPWTLCSILTWMVANSLASEGCPHPPVPAAATYVNVTGGLGEGRWGVRYVCDTGNNIAHLSSRNSTSWKFLS